MSSTGEEKKISPPKETRSSLLYFQERKRQWRSSPRRKISDLPPIVAPSPVKGPSPRRLGRRSRRVESNNPTQLNCSDTSVLDPAPISSQTSFAVPFKSHEPSAYNETPVNEPSSQGSTQNDSTEHSGSLDSDTKQSAIMSPQSQPVQTISIQDTRTDINTTPGGTFVQKNHGGSLAFGSHGTIEPSALSSPHSSEKKNGFGFGSQPLKSNPFSFASFGIDSSKKTLPESVSGGGLGSAIQTTPTPSLFGFSSSTSVAPGFSSVQTGANSTPFSKFGESDTFIEPKTTSYSHRDRLVAFYTKYNPKKLGSVDTTLEKYRGREDELFAKLSERYVTYPKATGDGPQYILNTTLGSIVVKVFSDVVPRAAANFGSLCLGRPVPPANRCNIKSYENTPWHRIVPGQLIQGGDTTVGNGTGGRSAFDQPLANDMWGHFNDEMFLAHDRAGLLSMANNGKHRNSSQFFITCKPLSHLNGKHVVFGEVLKGMDVVNAICSLEIDEKQCPKKEIQILDCGIYQENGKTEYTQSDECRFSKVDQDMTSHSSACEEKQIQQDSHEIMLVWTGIPRHSDGLVPNGAEPPEPVLNHKSLPHQDQEFQITKASFFGNSNYTIEVQKNHIDLLTTAVIGMVGGKLEIEQRATRSAARSPNIVTDQHDSGTRAEENTTVSILAVESRLTTTENCKCTQAQYFLRCLQESVDPILFLLLVGTGFMLSPVIYRGETPVSLPRRISASKSGASRTSLQKEGKEKKYDTILKKSSVQSATPRVNIGVLTYANRSNRINTKRFVSSGSQAEFLAIDPLAVQLCLALMK